MSALVCDICGGKLKVINGKMAVCESCGMEHSLDRIREKYRESQGVIHVDNAHLINNYYTIAKNAYDAGNKKETEAYCNKIIEIDSSNVNALMLKGQAVGWQSSIGSFRFKEASICFANALNNCVTETEKTETHSLIQDEFKGLATALISLRCERFQKWSDEEEAEGFTNDLDEIAEATLLYTGQTKESINRNYIFSNVALIVRLCIAIVSKSILLDYIQNGSKTAYSKLITKSDQCIHILQKTIDLCDDDDESDIQLYETMIEIQEALIRYNRSDTIENKWGAYVEVQRMKSDEVSRRKQLVNEYKNTMQKLEEK